MEGEDGRGDHRGDRLRGGRAPLHFKRGREREAEHLREVDGRLRGKDRGRRWQRTWTERDREAPGEGGEFIRWLLAYARGYEEDHHRRLDKHGGPLLQG